MSRIPILVAAFLLTVSLALAQNSSDAANSSDSVKPQPAAKVYHDGSIKDLDAVGNRKVGCERGIGNWYSLEKQIDMGRAYSRQVESSSKLIKDPVITEYVNRVGQNLVRNSDAQVPFTIKIIDTDDINAFALPGGFFYVDSGLILAADNEAELAGVMAHEIGHVAACHAAREMSRGQLMNLASIPLIFVGGGIGYAIQNVAGLAMPMGFLKFTRSFESEADFLGIQYMYKAGYDPQALTAFFEKVKALDKHKPGSLAKAFDTHPQTPDRIEKTQHEINTLLPPLPEYKVDTSDFEDVKARLSELENRHKLGGSEKADLPTLRRTSRTNSDSSDSGDNDDRPTLKRRDGSSP
ncbi:MAG TPA: M48 family metallopeptidase [Terriglobales bacterium]|nr:M48 family metallopeptidase [Terriglobales bacterium]